MNTRTIVLLLVLLLIVVGGIGVTVWRFSQTPSQNVRTGAQESTASPSPTASQGSSGGSCQVPAEVTNVSVDYPSCQ